MAAETSNCTVEGSIWETFTGVDAYGNEVSLASPLESRLEELASCSIDELLDEEDLVQEFRAGNPRLVERLCTADAMRTLVEHVTREPPEHLSEASRRRRPYAAAELLTCHNEHMLDVLTGPEHGGELLGLLWGFMDEPAGASAALAAYFCNTAASLFSRHPARVAEHLRGHQPLELLERFLERLDLRCFAELLGQLLCVEAPGHVIFPCAGLVPRLVACLDGPDHGGAQEHVALLLDQMLAQACAGDLCGSGDLLREFCAPGLVASLVDQALRRSPGAVPAAAVLASAVSHLHMLGWSPLLPLRSPERAQPPLVLQRPPAPSGDRGSQEALERSPSQAPLESVASALLGELCAQLPRLCAALQAPAVSPATESGELEEAIVLLLGRGADLATRLSELGARPGAHELRRALERHPPLERQELLADLREAARLQRAAPAPAASGALAVEILCLLVLLARTGCAVVLEAMVAASLLARCLELLLASGSSVLHNAVQAIIAEALASRQHAPALALSLLRAGQLAGRIVAEVRRDMEARAARGHRAGYMGQLRCICAELRGLGGRSPEVAEELARVEGWVEAVLPEIEAAERLEAEPLGGHPPTATDMPVPSFDCLIMRGAMADHEVDLSTEDLRDLHEELDEQQVLDLADVQRRRRAQRAPGTD